LLKILIAALNFSKMGEFLAQNVAFLQGICFDKLDFRWGKCHIATRWTQSYANKRKPVLIVTRYLVLGRVWYADDFHIQFHWLAAKKLPMPEDPPISYIYAYICQNDIIVCCVSHCFLCITSVSLSHLYTVIVLPVSFLISYARVLLIFINRPQAAYWNI